MDDIFADGIGTISVIGSTVRIDLVVYSPTKNDPREQPTLVFRQRITMSIDAFLQSAGKMQDAVRAISERLAKPSIGSHETDVRLDVRPTTLAPLAAVPAVNRMAEESAPERRAQETKPPIKPPFP